MSLRNPVTLIKKKKKKPAKDQLLSSHARKELGNLSITDNSQVVSGHPEVDSQHLPSGLVAARRSSGSTGPQMKPPLLL